jgi:hypothetical protein
MSNSASEMQLLIDELNELDSLRKARASADMDDEDDDDEYEDEDEDEEDDPNESEPDDDEDDEPQNRRKPFGKSFGVTLPDGSQVEAMDGTAVLAALQFDVSAVRGDMQKALRTLISITKSQAADMDRQRVQHELDLADLRKSYADDLQSLREEVTALGRQSKGRKSVLDVHEPPAVPDLIGADPAQDGKTILAKAATMNLDPVTMAVICELVNSKQPLPPHLAKAFQ